MRSALDATKRKGKTWRQGTRVAGSARPGTLKLQSSRDGIAPWRQPDELIRRGDATAINRYEPRDTCGALEANHGSAARCMIDRIQATKAGLRPSRETGI